MKLLRKQRKQSSTPPISHIARPPSFGGRWTCWRRRRRTPNHAWIGSGTLSIAPRDSNELSSSLARSIPTPHDDLKHTSTNSRVYAIFLLFLYSLQFDGLAVTEAAGIRARFFPSFHGTQLLSTAGGPNHPHLVLEDLTADLARPSIVDFKIGSRTWAPSHPQPYFEKCIKKDRVTTSLALGFRVSGLQIYDGDGSSDGDCWKPSRDDVRKFTRADVRRILRRFVSDGDDLDCGLAKEVYGGSEGVLAQLLELKSWFEDQTFYHFYSASVMVMFEKGKGRARVKMVDFAHVLEGDGVIDHNFLGGLCSLIKFVSEVLTDPGEGLKKKKGEGDLENGELQVFH